MKNYRLFSIFLVLLLIPSNLFAQNPKTEEVLLPTQKSKILEEFAKPFVSLPTTQLPKKEEKPLVGVQESKVKVAEKKTPVETDLEQVVVTATRNPQPLYQLALPVTVIRREQIEAEGVLQATDILRSVPGLAVVRSGRRGRTTSLFLRGSNANQVLFMIDGIQYSSPTTGFFDATNLLLEDVERIEVIKGPQSTLYGSEAMGGVVNIITRKGKLGRPKLEGRFEYGSQKSFYESGSVSGGAGPVDYFASMGRLDSDVGTANRRVEKDRYQNMDISGRVGIKLPFNSRLDTNYQFITGFSPLDDGAFRNDVNRWQKTKDNVIGTALTMNPFSWLTEIFKFSVFDERLVSIDPGDPGLRVPQAESVFKLDTQIYTLDWQNTVRPFEGNTITGGYEFQVQRGDNRTFDRIIRNSGFYIQDQQAFWDRLFLTAGARLEENSSFGDSLNPKVSAAYLLKETGTKFKGSFGTGFRTPTLNELFFPNFGNPVLQPEESRSFDWGFEQDIPFINAHFETAMYHNHFDNLIQAVPKAGGGIIAANTGKATMDGIELILSCEPIPGFFSLSGFYAYLATKDKSLAGGPLIRRPKNSGGINANFHWKKWSLNLDANLVGNRRDRTFAAGRPPFEVNTGYGMLDIMFGYEIFKGWELYFRGENITDTNYTEVVGFPSSGALFFGGVRAKV